MISDPAAAPLRQYLLGQATDGDCAAIEREYLADEAALHRMADAEEDLVEDYIDNRLAPDERRQFERHYLATAEHRVRVETIRRLRAAGGSPRQAPGAAAVERSSREPSYRWLAVAAAILLTIAAAWALLPKQPARTVAKAPSAAAPNMPSAATGASGSSGIGAPSSRFPQVFAVSISPAAVRSASTTAAIVIPPGAEVLGLRLEGEGASANIGSARAAIRTVAGAEIWQGPANAKDQPPGVVARVDVPAGLLTVDDYVVVLFGTNRSGEERERYRYFLRIRSR